MAQFVKMENGNLLNASCIAQIRPYAGINYNSKRLKVNLSIIVEGSEFGGDLIAATAVVPWPNPDNEDNEDNEMKTYDLVCGERNRLERTICEFFPDITRGILVDLTTYYPPDWIREQLRQAAENTAERIAEGVRKMEEEQNE